MSPSRLSISSFGPAATVRLSGGRLALASDGARLVLAAAASDGASADVLLHAAQAQAWAARVATVLDAHPPSADVTPVELRTPWLRGDDGEPALAIERLVRGPLVRWRLLVRDRAGEVAIALADAEVVEVLRRLIATTEAARDAG